VTGGVGADFPRSGSQARAPTWGHLALGLPALLWGQTRAPRGTRTGLPVPRTKGQTRRGARAKHNKKI